MLGEVDGTKRLVLRGGCDVVNTSECLENFMGQIGILLGISFLNQGTEHTNNIYFSLFHIIIFSAKSVFKL
jgi:hypothetical protein